ncbi:MAG: CBS domain-containing protein [Bradymonadia bacterium]
MIARDVMTADPITLTVDAPVKDAINLMLEMDFRHVPVVEGTTLVGMISDRDLRSYTLPLVMSFEQAEAEKTRLETPMSEVMQGGLLSVNRETELSDLIELMVEHRVGAVPVVDVDGATLVGIISYIDVLKAAQGVL